MPAQLTVTVTRRRAAVAVAALLSAVALIATGTSWAATQVFSDVPADHQFASEIEWMYDTGISTGYADGTYRPDEPVSRQAMAAFLQRTHDLRDDVGVASATSPEVIDTTAWQTVLSTTVTVPPGATADLVAAATTEVVCADAVTDSLYCHARITVDGVPMAPGAATLDSTAGDYEESHALQGYASDVGPGTYTVRLQGKKGDADLDAYWVSTRTLVVEAVLQPA